MRSYIVHRIKILREAILREEMKNEPDKKVLVAFLNRKEELENVLKEFGQTN
jgi:hypothetical protein